MSILQTGIRKASYIRFQIPRRRRACKLGFLGFSFFFVLVGARFCGLHLLRIEPNREKAVLATYSYRPYLVISGERFLPHY